MTIDCNSGQSCRKSLPVSTRLNTRIRDLTNVQTSDCSKNLVYITDDAGVVDTDKSAYSVWDISTTYTQGQRVLGTDDVVYESVLNNNLGNDPTLDNGTNWRGTYLVAATNKRYTVVTSFSQIQQHYVERNANCFLNSTREDARRFFEQGRGDFISPGFYFIVYWDRSNETLTQALDNFYECFDCFEVMTHTTYLNDDLNTPWENEPNLAKNLESWASINGQKLTITGTLDPILITSFTETTSQAALANEQSYDVAHYIYHGESCLDEYDNASNVYILWSNATLYNTGDIVIGSDNNVYSAINDGLLAIDPVGDGGVNWQLLYADDTCVLTGNRIVRRTPTQFLYAAILTSISSSAATYIPDADRKPIGGLQGELVANLTLTETINVTGVDITQGGQIPNATRYVNVYHSTAGNSAFMYGYSVTGFASYSLMQRKRIKRDLEKVLIDTLFNSSDTTITDVGLSILETSMVSRITEYASQGIITSNVQNFDNKFPDGYVVIDQGPGWILAREPISALSEADLSQGFSPEYFFCYVNARQLRFIDLTICTLLKPEQITQVI